MAITTAALQTALGDNQPTGVRVLMQFGGEADSLQQWLIQGGTTYPGRVKLVATTASDNATNQAATVTAALLAGPA